MLPGRATVVAVGLPPGRDTTDAVGGKPVFGSFPDLVEGSLTGDLTVVFVVSVVGALLSAEPDLLNIEKAKGTHEIPKILVMISLHEDCSQ